MTVIPEYVHTKLDIYVFYGIYIGTNNIK